MLHPGELQTNKDCSCLYTLRPTSGTVEPTGKHTDQIENKMGPHWNPNFTCFWFGDHAFLFNSQIFQMYYNNE